jgi:hypothetical protein
MPHTDGHTDGGRGNQKHRMIEKKTCLGPVVVAGIAIVRRVCVVLVISAVCPPYNAAYMYQVS